MLRNAPATVGCSANAAKAKLTVSMAPATLAVDQLGTLALGNSAVVNQTVSFTLNFLAGGLGYGAFSFSVPCTTPALNAGVKNFIATVVVQAHATACTFAAQKRFTAPASPVQFSLPPASRASAACALARTRVLTPSRNYRAYTWRKACSIAVMSAAESSPTCLPMRVLSIVRNWWHKATDEAPAEGTEMTTGGSALADVESGTMPT